MAEAGKITVAVAAHRGDSLQGTEEAEAKFEFVREACTDDPEEVIPLLNAAPKRVLLYIVYPGFPDEVQDQIVSKAKQVPTIQHIVKIPNSLLDLKEEGERQEIVNNLLKPLKFRLD